ILGLADDELEAALAAAEADEDVVESADERQDDLRQLAERDQDALVDLVAACDALPPELARLALEVLSCLGPERALARLLRVLDVLDAEAPYELLVHLGGLGLPEAEARLVDLLARYPGFLAAARGLERCGGQMALERLRLVARLALGEDAAALEAHGLLEEIARRHPELVAEAVVAQLAPGRRDGGCRPDRRAWLHQVLLRAGHPAALHSLRGWVDARLVADAPVDEAFSTALQALGAIGEADGVDVLLTLGADPGDPLRRLAALEALGHVPPEVARDLALLPRLVDRLDDMERDLEEPEVRQALHGALRRLTGAPVSPAAAAWRVYLVRSERWRGPEGPEGHQCIP
ncbi:MAG: hypothetical protein KIT58_15905, partial [Planctomycetota bacterium]|nr:hypothetical protein [Planctomycetota bacterium]